VELLTGLSFVAGFWKLGVPTDTISIFSHLILYSIFSILILVALHDQKTSYVLSGYVYAAVAVTLIYLVLSYAGSWSAKELGAYLLPNIVSAIVAALPFTILYVFSKGAWMGAGDIEVAVLLGFLLGWPNFLVALYFAFIVGSLWGIIKVYMLKNAKLKSELPLAPFLIAGVIFAFLFAEQLVSLYVKIFLG
jgi:prepilin signal peptidase PulO-like enzyme (type II secretory pathway)